MSDCTHQYFHKIISLNADVFITGLLLTEENIPIQNVFIPTENHSTRENQRGRRLENVLNVRPAPEYRSIGRNQGIA